LIASPAELQLLPLGFLQVTQVLVGHVLLPLLVHLLRREPLHAIQDGWDTTTTTTTQMNASNTRKDAMA